MLHVDRFHQDSNGNGIIDYMEEEHKSIENGTISYSATFQDFGADGVDKMSESVYDDQGRIVTEYSGITTTNYYYDEFGRLDYQHTDQPDNNGDGQPDYRDSLDYSYNDKGLVSAKEYVSFQDGQFTGIDYRLESFTYNDKGLLTELRVDDWVIYDFEIAWYYRYNSRGQVVQVKHEDPFDYGDDRPRTTETYKYSKSGVLTESNIYDTYVNDKYVLEDKAKFTYWGDGLLKKEVHTGQDGAWHTITGWQEESWYNDMGLVDTQLVSFDQNGDGKFEAGTRTLKQFAYNEDGSLSSSTVDFNTGDGVIEEWNYFDTLVA